MDKPTSLTNFFAKIFRMDQFTVTEFGDYTSHYIDEIVRLTESL